MSIPNSGEKLFNRTFLKGLITAFLILLLMIPVLFVHSLINERHVRQRTVAREVSEKWASAQTLSGPFLYVPYTHMTQGADGRPLETRRHFWILPEDLELQATVTHELRRRSIFDVLLYRSVIRQEGSFIPEIPRTADPTRIHWEEAQICVGLSDFRGIEQRLIIRVDGVDYEMTPGLPARDLSERGLSVPLPLRASMVGTRRTFDLPLQVRGSERLHFIPLGGNSSYTMQSDWHSPSFDGNSLPTQWHKTDSGFQASWQFNKANRTFGTVLEQTDFDISSLAFGVSLIEPADHYTRTERTVKYAILIIGLTLSLFYFLELRQRQLIHPVQYILVGLALVIFYTLLLSISEFLTFDPAYLIAAVATVGLVTLYARALFGHWRSAGLFGAVLTFLYGFIFVLVRLEDTALLVGSIGLFLILAAIMYGSRKLNWYA